MKIKDIIRLAAIFLQLDINREIFAADADRGAITAEINTDNRLKLLKDCSSFVLNQLATDYLPLKHIQRLEAPDGFVPYGEFEKDIIEVVEAIDNRGVAVKFSHLPDGLKLDGRGLFEITYFYRPGDKSFWDEAETGNCRVSARIVALGTAAEYMFLSGMYEEAQLWDGRFKDSLKVALRKKSQINLRPRRWL